MRKIARCFYLCVCCMLVGVVVAQNTNSGDIRGVVTDQSGAVVPGVTVTVLNVATGVSKGFVTDHDGLYDTGSIVTGTYRITFAKEGFEELARGPITVEAGSAGVNAELRVGAATEQVTVTENVPLLQTESGEQSTTLSSEVMQKLPQVGEDWQNFTILIPGAAGAPGAPQGAVNPGQLVAVNGNLPYSDILSDGASNTLPSSMNIAFSDNFETVAELQTTTSSFSAQYGIGGVIFNQITKGGTSTFHGSAYDYFQNDALDAAPYGFGNLEKVPTLRYNDFGGSISGPVLIPMFSLRKKAFFYFNYDQTIDHAASSNTTTTVPTTSVLNGDFAGQRTLYDPTTESWATDASGNQYPVRKSFISEYGSNAIPQGLWDSVAAKFQQFWPTPSTHVPFGKFVPGTVNSVGILTNNWFASIPSSSPVVKYFGRLDYDITPSNRLTMTDHQIDNPVIYESAVTACPVGCESGDVDSNNAQISDVWNISSSTINEARLGYSFAVSNFGDLAIGKGYPAQLGWKFAKADDVPYVEFSNTYPYASIGSTTNAIYTQHVFDPSDVVTMIRGKHILHFGGEFLIYRDDSTAWGNTNAGTFGFSGQYTQNWVVNPATGVAAPDPTTGVEYADYLLGMVNTWSANVSPEYGGRLKSPQMFVQDDYKVLPTLTLNFGLRYQINHGWNEVHGNINSFDPTITNPATGTLGAMWYASTHADGRTSLQANVFDDFMPRIGFSWLLHANTTVRGGFGVYSYNWSLDQYGNGIGNGMGGSFSSSGNATDLTNGKTPVAQWDSSGANLPYTAAGTDPTRFNGQAVAYYEYHTPVSRIYQWNLAIQKQFGANWVEELAYVASHGFNLPFPTSLSQVPLSELGPNDASERPYPQYTSVTGSTNNAISNYNSLQASATRRLSSGLSLSFNYVWSHWLDDQDSSGWGSRGGPQPYQLANDPGANYANSNFDVPQALKGDVIYQLPFGEGRQFLNSGRMLNEIVGGWQLSGIVLLSSGQPFNLIDNGNTYAQAGSQFPNRAAGVSIKPQHRTIEEWYNPAAFTLPANGTFGNVNRNSLFGPGISEFNISGGKTFALTEQSGLEIRADTTNVFNHPSWGLPNATLSGAAGPGQPFTSLSNITTVQIGGRAVQLTARLHF